jgi:hypothetical protein
MSNQIPLNYKVSQRFNVSPAELIALIPQQHQRVLGALVEEIERYEAKGEPYLEALRKGERLTWDERDYLRGIDRLIRAIEREALFYLEPIYKAREAQQEERQRALAESEAKEWVSYLAAQISSLQSELREAPPDVDSLFTKESGVAFFMRSHNALEEIGALVKEWIDSVLASFPRIESAISYDYSARYFQVLCQARYVLKNGVPSLVFSLETHCVVVASVRTNNCRLESQFHGYSYIHSIPAEPLGYLCEHFSGLRHNDWQTIPLVLIQGILNGNAEVEGVELLQRGTGEARTIYGVKNFKETITIPDSFADWLRRACATKGLAKGLLSCGVIDEKVAEILQRKIQSISGSLQAPRLAGGDYGNVVEALVGVGYPRAKAEEAGRYVMEKYPSESLEDKVRSALAYLGN